MSIQPFTIAIQEADLDDLRERIAHTRWPNQSPGIGVATAIIAPLGKPPRGQALARTRQRTPYLLVVMSLSRMRFVT